MRFRLLSALVLLGAISFVQADYVVIIVNLNAKVQAPQKGPPQGGGRIPGGGIPGGGPGGGIPGGGIPGGGVQIGGPGGIPGPGGAQRGGGQLGMPGPGSGGGRLGMPGIPGMPGMPGGNASTDADENQHLVVAVVEISTPTKKALWDFNTPRSNQRGKVGGTELL